MTAEPATEIIEAGGAAVARAARLLAAGGLVAFPTETVYGLGADATNGHAVARLYDAKGRPAFNPLIAHVADVAAARRLARFDAAAERLAAAFWPGPLTLVLPKARTVRSPISPPPGSTRIAVRVPAHPVARDLLAAFGRPVVAPSANRSGHVSPTTAAARAGRSARAHRPDRRRRADAGRRGIDHRRLPRRAGRCCGPARLPRAEIERVLPLAEPLAGRHAGQQRGRGAARARQLASHYAPRARLRLDARERRTPARRCSPSGRCRRKAPSAPRMVLNLSPRGDLIEAAANLFSHLRALDAAGAAAIAVMPVPHEGLGEAINDRLARAAAPRALTADAAERGHGPRHPPCDRRARCIDKPPTTPSPAAARPLRRDRRRRNTPSPIRRRRRPIWSRCATSITAARRWCCGPARSPRSSAILKLANETGDARSCRRAAIPAWSAARPRIHGEIVLSLTRLDRIREVDPTSNTMTCEAGVTLQRAREAAAAADRLFPHCCRRKAPAPSAAISRPMPAAPRRSPTASRARTRSASKWCWPTAACSTISTSSRRTIPATT